MPTGPVSLRTSYPDSWLPGVKATMRLWNSCFRWLYQELRRLAASKLADERRDHTLQPTALVHEAFLRLLDQQQPQVANRQARQFPQPIRSCGHPMLDRAEIAQARMQPLLVVEDLDVL